MQDQANPLAVAALQSPPAAREASSVVFGAVSPEEVVGNLGHATCPIPAGLWSGLKSAGLLADEVPTG